MIRPNLIESMSLTARSKAAIKALLTSPAAAKALKEQEEAVIAERRNLLEAEARVSAPYLKPIEKAAAAYRAAVQHRERAKVELEASYGAERDAWAALYAAEYGEVRARATIESSLLETADGRIGTFVFWLEELDNQARNALSFFHKMDPTITARQPELEWNTAKVKAARAVIRACLDECQVLLHEVITYDDLTARFDGMCERLVEPLAAVELNPPQIDAEGSVGRALHWDTRRRAWRVQKMFEMPRQLEPIVDKAGKKVPLA